MLLEQLIVAQERALGHAGTEAPITDEEFEHGLIALAAHGRIVASLNASAPRFRYSDRAVEAAELGSFCGCAAVADARRGGAAVRR